MRVRLRLLCLLGVLAVAGPLPAPEALAGSPSKVADEPYPAELRARVRKAIELGLKHLRTRQMLPVEITPGLDGSDFQEAAAVRWVLRRAGVPSDDPAFAEASKRLHARAPNDVEEASLLLLALCSQPLVGADPFADVEAPGGKGVGAGMTPEDRALMNRAVGLLLKRQIKPGAGLGALGKKHDSAGGWECASSVRTEDRLAFADVPTTYLALLGLESAARSGAEVPAGTWLSALGLLLGWQAPEGPKVTLRMNTVRGKDRLEWTEPAQARGFGWSGSLSDTPSGYDTVAAALSLAMCQDALQKERGFTKDLRRRTRLALRDALAWVQQSYDIKANPVTGKGVSDVVTGPLYHHHWLQGLARLGIHARMRFIGTHDWYQEGAEELLRTQGSGGAWNAIWWSNCYAMLFLMRASLHSITPVVTVSEGG